MPGLVFAQKANFTCSGKFKHEDKTTQFELITQLNPTALDGYPLTVAMACFPLFNEAPEEHCSVRDDIIFCGCQQSKMKSTLTFYRYSGRVTTINIAWDGTILSQGEFMCKPAGKKLF